MGTQTNLEAKSGAKGLVITPEEPKAVVPMIVNLSDFESKMKLLSENVKNIKDTFEKTANADNTRAEKFGAALNNLAELIGNFQGLVDAVQKANADNDESSEGPVHGIKATLEGKFIS